MNDDKNIFVLERFRDSVRERYARFIKEEAIDKQEVLIALNRAIEILKERKSGFYECFHCGARAVGWDSDFDFDDYGYDGEGIIHVCHCNNCGAEIEYIIRTDDDESDGDTSETHQN